MKLYNAPYPVTEIVGLKIFLAGTIDNGRSENWQNHVINYFKNSPCTFFNPRREEWDDSWTEEASDPVFSQQVNWELDQLEKADLIIMNFLPGSTSPISLLELGLFAGKNKMMVCCPKRFWKSGNVELVCLRYGIKVFEDLDELLNSVMMKVLLNNQTLTGKN